MTFDELIGRPPQLHRKRVEGKMVPCSWQLANDTLVFINQNISDKSVTLETGQGLSTVVFALKQTLHTAINPSAIDPSEEFSPSDEILKFCVEHSIATGRLKLINGRSEKILPGLSQDESLDLCLIDGGHAFPIPFLDWFYIAPMLKVGGLLVIDDLQIWTGYTLACFLAMEPEWKLHASFQRSKVFEKVARTTVKNWNKQAFVTSWKGPGSPC